MRFRLLASQSSPPSATEIHRKRGLELTLTGLVYLTMTMFMAAAALNSDANLLFGVFGLMIGVMLISYLIGRIVLQNVSLQRSLPELAVVGQPTTIVYEFSNKKRYWPSLSVMIAELDGTEAFTRQLHAYLLHAAAEMTAVVPTEAVAKRRGLYQMNRYEISTSFPFGFIERAVVRGQKDTMLVYPALGQVDPKVLSICRSSDSSGAVMRPSPGGNDEFYGVKEFREGDNRHHIYWRRSARTGVLVSREMTRVSPPRLVLLVDTHCPLRTVDALGEVERCIAMAASLAGQALEAGLSVGLVAYMGEWACTKPGRGKRHRRDLLAQLARLPRNTEHDLDELLTVGRLHLEAGSTPVLITPRADSDDLSDHQRSGLVTFASPSPEARNWFRFPDTVDFTRCMPVDQEPRTESQHRRRRISRRIDPAPTLA